MMYVRVARGHFFSQHRERMWEWSEPPEKKVRGREGEIRRSRKMGEWGAGKRKDQGGRGEEKQEEEEEGDEMVEESD